MVPEIVMKLRVGKMALKNVTFLVCDDKMTNEPIIIGRPVLEHLRIDTKTLPEERALDLDGTDCSNVANPTRNAGGFLTA